MLKVENERQDILKFRAAFTKFWPLVFALYSHGETGSVLGSTCVSMDANQQHLTLACCVFHGLADCDCCVCLLSRNN